MSQDCEGWDVDHRPAIKGLAIFMALLLLLVIGSGLFYNHRYATRTRPDPRPFPGPQLETIDSAPGDHDPVPALVPPLGIDRTMAETAAKGAALWNG